MVLYKLAPTIIHRRPTTTLAPKGETTHYDLCVALLLQIMFAVHARGASNLSPLRTFGPSGRQPSSPQGLSIRRLYGFRRQRRYKKWRRRRRTSPAQRYYIPPEGESPQPTCKAKPITGRTLGAQGQRPGGAINPHARKGVSTFGNTGKHLPGHPSASIYFR